MKRFLIIAGVVVLVIIIGLTIFTLIASEDRPEAISGGKAENLAQKIYDATNKEAWDSLDYIRWTFRESNHYTWDRQQNLVEVVWDEYRVLLDPESVSGIAFKKGDQLKGEEEQRLLEEAFKLFCNDGFWMNAFTKLHDPGTNRGIHISENGDTSLLVTYTSGGVTPGDAYLWKVDDEGLPLSFKMWVSIIPVGGLEFTWEDWDTLYNGALIAQNHSSELLEVPITGIKSGPTLTSVGKNDTLFMPLEK